MVRRRVAKDQRPMCLVSATVVYDKGRHIAEPDSPEFRYQNAEMGQESEVKGWRDADAPRVTSGREAEALRSDSRRPGARLQVAVE